MRCSTDEQKVKTPKQEAPDSSVQDDQSIDEFVNETAEMIVVESLEMDTDITPDEIAHRIYQEAVHRSILLNK